MYGSRFYCEPEYYWLTVQTAIDKASFLLYIEHSLDMFTSESRKEYDR